jgi:hypothetical protein
MDAADIAYFGEIEDYFSYRYLEGSEKGKGKKGGVITIICAHLLL